VVVVVEYTRHRQLLPAVGTEAGRWSTLAFYWLLNAAIDEYHAK
jgi:hypothetical protein